MITKFFRVAMVAFFAFFIVAASTATAALADTQALVRQALDEMARKFGAENFAQLHIGQMYNQCATASSDFVVIFNDLAQKTKSPARAFFTNVTDVYQASGKIGHATAVVMSPDGILFVEPSVQQITSAFDRGLYGQELKDFVLLLRRQGYTALSDDVIRKYGDLLRASGRQISKTTLDDFLKVVNKEASVKYLERYLGAQMCALPFCPELSMEVETFLTKQPPIARVISLDQLPRELGEQAKRAGILQGDGALATVLGGAYDHAQGLEVVEYELKTGDRFYIAYNAAGRDRSFLAFGRDAKDLFDRSIDELRANTALTDMQKLEQLKAINELTKAAHETYVAQQTCPAVKALGCPVSTETDIMTKAVKRDINAIAEAVGPLPAGAPKTPPLRFGTDPKEIIKAFNYYGQASKAAEEAGNFAEVQRLNKQYGDYMKRLTREQLSAAERYLDISGKPMRCCVPSSERAARLSNISKIMAEETRTLTKLLPPRIRNVSGKIIASLLKQGGLALSAVLDRLNPALALYGSADYLITSLDNATARNDLLGGIHNAQDVMLRARNEIMRLWPRYIAAVQRAKYECGPEDIEGLKHTDLGEILLGWWDALQAAMRVHDVLRDAFMEGYYNGKWELPEGAKTTPGGLLKASDVYVPIERYWRANQPESLEYVSSIAQPEALQADRERFFEQRIPVPSCAESCEPSKPSPLPARTPPATSCLDQKLIDLQTYWNVNPSDRRSGGFGCFAPQGTLDANGNDISGQQIGGVTGGGCFQINDVVPRAYYAPLDDNGYPTGEPILDADGNPVQQGTINVPWSNATSYSVAYLRDLRPDPATGALVGGKFIWTCGPNGGPNARRVDCLEPDINTEEYCAGTSSYNRIEDKAGEILELLGDVGGASTVAGAAPPPSALAPAGGTFGSFLKNIAQGVKNLFTGAKPAPAAETYNVNANFASPPLEAGKTYKPSTVTARNGTAVGMIQPFTEPRDGGVALCFRVRGTPGQFVFGNFFDTENGQMVGGAYTPSSDASCVENPPEGRSYTLPIKFRF